MFDLWRTKYPNAFYHQNVLTKLQVSNTMRSSTKVDNGHKEIKYNSNNFCHVIIIAFSFWDVMGREKHAVEKGHTYFKRKAQK